MTTEKYCTKCGRKFIATGREVICPFCREQAAEDAKRAAVLKAKRASWNGESVPVRISGRASTVIRAYGKHHNLPFAAALDDLLKASEFFKSIGVNKWEEVEPYRSHRRDKHTTDTASKPQDVQDEQDAPQDVQDEQEIRQDKPVKPVKMVAKKAAKTTSKASASKASTSKTAGKATDASKKGEKAC